MGRSRYRLPNRFLSERKTTRFHIGPPAVNSIRRGYRHRSPRSGETHTTTGVLGSESITEKQRLIPLPGSVAVSHPEAFRCGNEARSSCSWRPPSPLTIPATCKGIYIQLWASSHSVARLATGKTTIIAQSLRAGTGRSRGACLGTPGSRRCSKVSISVIAVRGGGAGASAFKSRRSSMISISVGTGRGGGVSTGTLEVNVLVLPEEQQRQPLPGPLARLFVHRVHRSGPLQHP